MMTHGIAAKYVPGGTQTGRGESESVCFLPGGQFVGKVTMCSFQLRCAVIRGLAAPTAASSISDRHFLRRQPAAPAQFLLQRGKLILAYHPVAAEALDLDT